MSLRLNHCLVKEGGEKDGVYDPAGPAGHGPILSGCDMVHYTTTLLELLQMDRRAHRTDFRRVPSSSLKQNETKQNTHTHTLQVLLSYSPYHTLSWACVILRIISFCNLFHVCL